MNYLTFDEIEVGDELVLSGVKHFIIEIVFEKTEEVIVCKWDYENYYKYDKDDFNKHIWTFNYAPGFLKKKQFKEEMNNIINED